METWVLLEMDMVAKSGDCCICVCVYVCVYVYVYVYLYVYVYVCAYVCACVYAYVMYVSVGILYGMQL